MTKKVEKFTIETDVVNSSVLLGKLLKSEEDLMKSNVILHFHDDDPSYEKFTAGDSNTNCDSLVSQFLKKVFYFTKKFPDNVFFDVTLRGAACLQNVLVDLVRASHSTGILPCKVKDDFSCWTDPFAPNLFCTTVEKECYIKPLLEVISKSLFKLREQMNVGGERYPRIYFIDIVKLDDNNRETSDAVRWVFADIPCGKDAEIGNKFMKFLQQDPAINEINVKIRKEPLIAGLKGFLLKDTTSTVVFNALYNDCLREFGKTREIISKWFVLPQGIVKLETELYLSNVATDLEYFKKFENGGKLVEMLPQPEAEKREFEIKLLKESNDRIVDDIKKNMDKINNAKEKILKNNKLIEEYERNTAVIEDEIKDTKVEYNASTEENIKLNSQLDGLNTKKTETINDIESGQKKIDALLPIIEKLSNFCDNLEKENSEEENERSRIFSKANELNTSGLDLYKKTVEKLENISAKLDSFKVDAMHNKEKSNNAYNITKIENLVEIASKDYFEFLELEKDARKDFSDICSSSENNLLMLKDKINLRETEISKEIEGISMKFNDKVQEKIKSILNNVTDDLDKDLCNFKSKLNEKITSDDMVTLRDIFKSVL
uniref:Viral A-type inclusion protein n=1 Tax=Strongyloides stercoralis TaxID=6248 RepID=A0A0K0DY75_STRER